MTSVAMIPQKELRNNIGEWERWSDLAPPRRLQLAPLRPSTARPSTLPASGEERRQKECDQEWSSSSRSDVTVIARACRSGRWPAATVFTAARFARLWPRPAAAQASAAESPGAQARPLPGPDRRLAQGRPRGPAQAAPHREADLAAAARGAGRRGRRDDGPPIRAPAQARAGLNGR